MKISERKIKNYVFRGKSKVLKYIKSSNRNTHQIELLSMYVEGKLEEALKKYDFDEIEVFADGNNKIGLDLQISLRKKNKTFGFDFLSEYYETCFYITGCTPEDIESSIVKSDYNDFNLDAILTETWNRLC